MSAVVDVSAARGAGDGVSTVRTGCVCSVWVFFFQAEDGIRDVAVTGVQTCALPIFLREGFASKLCPARKPLLLIRIQMNECRNHAEYLYHTYIIAWISRPCGPFGIRYSHSRATIGGPPAWLAAPGRSRHGHQNHQERHA